VFLFDAHSFGRSEPLDEKHRSLVENFNHLVDDVFTFRTEVVEKAQPSPPLPVFLGGLSMGGMTAILGAIRDQSAWQGIICISPAVDCPRTFQLKILEAIQGVILMVAPNARLVPQPRIPDITLNEAERAGLETDEFFDPKKVRVRMGNTFLNAWTHIAQNEHKLTLPILIHYSTIDKVVYPPATERFAKNVASKDVTLKPFDSFAHDLYMDTCKEESWPLVISWVLERLGPQGGTKGATDSGPAKLSTGEYARVFA